MLNGYTIKNKTHTGPPRMLAVRERATKFREKAGCLAWTKRDGSNPINDYILSLLPAGATTNRALGGDLMAQQVAERKAVNKGKYGNRRRKAKREAEAKEQGQEDSSDDSLKGDEDGEEAALGEEIDEDAVGEGEEYDASPTRSNPYESDEQNLTMSLGLNSESFATLGSGTGGRQRSDQHRGHKRGIDEDSSDTNPTPVNRNIKRRKIDTSDEGTALGASHSNVPSQRASRKSRMSSSYSSLNQKKAADAPGRRKRAITAGGGNRRKHIATAPAKRESSSECEGFSPTSSLLPEIGSTSEIDEDVLMRAVSDVTSGDNGYEASSEGAGTDKPDSSSEIDDDTPAETSDGLNPEDTRFRIPSNGPEINRLRRALQITVADFALRSGTGENNLGEAYDLFEHEDESYISQRYHMQQVFDSVCKEKGLGQLHPLFCLPEWTGGFGNWNFELGDDKGPWLQQMLQEDTAGHQ